MWCLNNCLAGLAQAVLRSVVQVATSLSVIFALAQSAAAQTEPPLANGARVRVVIPAADGQSQRYVTGTLVRLTGDTVVIRPGGVVALNDGRRLEQFVGTRHHSGSGAVLGAILGTFTGFVIGAATWQPCTQTGFLSCLVHLSKGERQIIYGLLGAAGGIAVGSVIGSLIRTDAWRSVHTGGIRLTVAPAAAGISLAF